MITYPILHKQDQISVTAVSSGVPPELHFLLKEAKEKLERDGYQVDIDDTAWTHKELQAAPASERAKALHVHLDKQPGVVIPPWGGHRLISMLEHIDFARIPHTWLLGYSDTSVLLLAVTLRTGIATAHGTNFVDLRGSTTDSTTAMWERVLMTPNGKTVSQRSSEHFQPEWQFDNPTPHIFHLTEPTEWKSIGGSSVQGRLLGGCIDVIHHLVGTPYGDVAAFQRDKLGGKSILWYFENCDMNTSDVWRSLQQMKLAGWFDHISGIMFGRSSANQAVEDLTIELVYEELASELQVPVLYDIDCGHMPPQVTLINGAFADVTVENGKGIIVQEFRE
ncbi:LD-carboxypeptidase [Paenalkalicoccus suaedae]|uniref:LD-carboxypeptidase n=1 Tax=Paenalkalicoccus suaedae TaxID=2592382 RepID=A0A859F9Y8_9BACI|nr:S66 peptidase family protein [Paenalkalicoccus suaedae]QKS70033.1 LD-carboxypeptidase [Paenalkalicoccus suaedae]